ncbi:MAG: glycosyltransferase, partial [Chitinispirillaceae bacterium]|nr:glycosyltransferase [Chitinispirillaceae bacterium]
TRIRLYHFCRGLAKSHTVYLADMECDQSACRDSGIEHICREVYRLPAAPASFFSRLADRLLLKPFSADPVAFHRLRAWYGRHDFDVVISAKSLGFWYAFHAGIPVRALGVVDDGCTAHLHSRAASVTASYPLQKLRLRLQSLKLERAERAMARACDLVATPSPKEAEYLGSICGPEKTVVVPNGVDIGYFGMRPWKGDVNGEILFFGTFRFEANVNAALHLVDGILPLLPPDRRVCLAGEDPPEALRERAARDPRVRVTGYVEDLRPYLERCGAVVIPVRIGTGTRLKILHAMAAGCPVVSTTMGAEGIGAIDGKEIVLADSAAAFTGALARMAEDRSFARTLGDAGRTLVTRAYDWEAIVDGFKQRLAERRAAKREGG